VSKLSHKNIDIKDKVTIKEVNKFLDDNKKVMEHNTRLLAMYLKKESDEY
jgi:hypothetical protein